MINDHIQANSSYSHLMLACRLPRISSICALLLTAILYLKREVSATSGAVAFGGCIFQATTAPVDLHQFYHWSITSLA
jgi:hypothetical protein